MIPRRISLPDAEACAAIAVKLLQDTDEALWTQQDNEFMNLPDAMTPAAIFFPALITIKQYENKKNG